MFQRPVPEQHAEVYMSIGKKCLMLVCIAHGLSTMEGAAVIYLAIIYPAMIYILQVT